MTNRRNFLLSAPLASLVWNANQSAAADLSGPLLDRPRIGAEFFLNQSETRESVDRHFTRMADTGLTIVRIFTIWDHIERRQGQWDFTRYDWIYDAAARNRQFIANTLCAEDPPGWMGTAPFYHAWRDLSNPDLRPHSERYLEQVISRYKAHPGHGVWLLQNEPGIREGVSPHLLGAWARWLQRRYGSIDALNRTWYRQLRRFEDAPPPVEPREAGWADYPSNLDWRRFRCDHLADQQQWLRAKVDQHHPGALTHINPPGLTSNMPAGGRDLWKLKPAAHFLGASMHAAWHFTMFARRDFGVAYGFCCDLVRSASSPAPWWVTELQAGPTVFSGNRPMNPTPAEITGWLWDAVGNGTRGVVFWLWHPRTEANEAGEWGLAGPEGEPTERTRATKAVAAVLERHRDFFAAAKPEPARVAIVHSPDTLILQAVDGWRRQTDEVMLSLMGCYKALHRAGLPVDFLNASELEAGGAARYRVLYLPHCFALSSAAVAAIRRFVENGGTVWADGLTGWKDENGRTFRFPPGPLGDVFGCAVDDVHSVWEPFSLSGAVGETAGEQWRLPLRSLGAKPLLANAAAMEHRFGKGRAMYFGTGLSLGYMRRESAQVAKWIAAPAIEASRDLRIQLVTAPAGVACRRLLMPDGARSAAVLTNWSGAPAQVRLAAPAQNRAVEERISGKRLTPLPGGSAARMIVDVPLRAGGAAVVVFG